MTALFAMLLTAAALLPLLVGRVTGFGYRQEESAKQTLRACLMGVVAGLMTRYVGPMLSDLLCGFVSASWLKWAIYAVVAVGLCGEVSRLWALDYAIATSPRDGQLPSSLKISVAVGVGFAECQIAALLLQAMGTLPSSAALVAVAHCWAVVFLSVLMGYYHDLSRFVAEKPYRGMALAVPFVLHSLVAAGLPSIPYAVGRLSLVPSAGRDMAILAFMSAIALAAAVAFGRVLQAKSNQKLVSSTMERFGKKHRE